MAIAAPSPKLQALLKDFQQIASMSGYLNHAFDPPQLRLFFTLYGRVMVTSPEQGLALTPQLQAWCDAVSNRLREASSGTIMQPQVQVSTPQVMPDGRDYLVATVTFNTKVTESSYLRIRTAILAIHGVDVANLFISQPDSGEQALEICDQLVRSGALDIIVIDSVAALVPKAEIDGEMGDSHVGLQARLMSQALRKMTGTISKTHTCVVFINQIRMKIGVMFGNPETTTGGNALKFYASVRLDVRSIQSIKGNTGDPLVAAKDEDSSVIGKKTKVKVVKNKVAPPLKVATFDIMYGEGISRTSELVELGTQLEIIQKSGSWYSYKDSRLGQGAENVKKLFTDNPELADEVEGLIREKLGLRSTVEV